jgi:hypothetical protein
VNWHDAVFPDVSIAVHVTVVVPTAKLDPEAGLQFTVCPGQLSLLLGAVYVTVAEPDPAGFSSVVIFDGQAPIVGSCVSLTVTVKLHLESGDTPLAAVHVTIVGPFGKAEPEGGMHVTVGVGHPLAVGVL